jgi:sec-independent protein translocase protein TatB
VFDVGFWELLFIFTLALLILGPDKLPGVVSTVGRWTGRARALARGLRLQIEREMAEDQTVQRPPASGSAKPHPAAERQQAAAAKRAGYEQTVAEKEAALASRTAGTEFASSETEGTAEPASASANPEADRAESSPQTDASAPEEPVPVTDDAGPEKAERRDER